jgi:hypothetical protein
MEQTNGGGGKKLHQQQAQSERLLNETRKRCDGQSHIIFQLGYIPGCSFARCSVFFLLLVLPVRRERGCAHTTTITNKK